MNTGDICTDLCMTKVYVNLVSDFRSSLGKDYASAPLGALLQGGIKGFRAYKFPARSTVSPNLFKREYQLETFFKRYRFEHDVFTDEELLEKSRNKFYETQYRLDKGITDGPLVNMVLRAARRHAKEILGVYDLETHQSLCRFGKRACVGSNYRISSLDEKLSRPLTGSLDHIRWFKSYLKTDELLRSAIAEASGKKRPSYEMCESLTLSHVPKSFKSLRAICPDTLLGSFYTAGLGRYIQDKLAEAGLNIRTLQQRHGKLALEGSINRKLVTADLSAASDSLTGPLLMRVLPLPWYRAVMFGRIPFVKVDGEPIRMNTVLTMGLGHTFPLQTLVFYCLLRGILELSKKTGTVSVYGDDLIYPRSIHHYVVGIFPRLQLLLNGDKTYARDYFRESCGSDYYRGCGVRPFSMEAEHRHISVIDYEQFLYKLYNGLLQRWAREEIPRTLEFITCELILRCGRILCVPASFPDSSGIKSFEWEDGYFHHPLSPCYPYHSLWFKYLKNETGRRKAGSQACYYWERLRSKEPEREIDPYVSVADMPVLIWSSHPHREVTTESGDRVKELIPQTAAKQDAVTKVARAATTEFGLLQLHRENRVNVATYRVLRQEYVRPTRHPLMRRRVGWRGWPLT